MKNIYISIIVISSFVIFSFLSCNDPETSRIVSALIGPEGGTITSSDRRLTLDIPAGALMDDTTITITKLRDDEQPSGFDGEDEINILNSYELTPDGLEFELPVTATYLLDDEPVQDDGSLLVGLLFGLLTISTNGEVEPLDNVQTMVDGDSNASTVMGELTHFSNLTIIDNKLPNPDTGVFEEFNFIATLLVPNKVIVDIQFEATVRVISEQSAGIARRDITKFIELPEYMDRSNFPIEIIESKEPTIPIPLFPESTRFYQRSLDYICNNEDNTARFAAIIEAKGAGTFLSTSTFFVKTIDCESITITPPDGTGTRPPGCGDGVRDPSNEACDGTDFGGLTCVDLGFDGGTLMCIDCLFFDFSMCFNNPPPEENTCNSILGTYGGLFILLEDNEFNLGEQNFGTERPIDDLIMVGGIIFFGEHAQSIETADPNIRTLQNGDGILDIQITASQPFVDLAGTASPNADGTCTVQAEGRGIVNGGDLVSEADWICDGETCTGILTYAFFGFEQSPATYEVDISQYQMNK